MQILGLQKFVCKNIYKHKSAYVQILSTTYQFEKCSAMKTYFYQRVLSQIVRLLSVTSHNADLAANPFCSLSIFLQRYFTFISCALWLRLSS